MALDLLPKRIIPGLALMATLARKIARGEAKTVNKRGGNPLSEDSIEMCFFSGRQYESVNVLNVETTKAVTESNQKC